ncbi:hypothetical protein [Lysobacter gummosus]|uniref:Uncharacterized protein n=1 Tax=Lysobacter gummosus TaxID=262324 RepID=A0ABY3X9A2_9GAMM|nr:hypothetical protein [Lysobacter gummosus]UNP27712.1 hypothetical protein MOV92_14420 [Lysobacter gummosus]
MHASVKKASLLPAAALLPLLIACAIGHAADMPKQPDSGPLAAKAVSDAIGATLRADVPTALAALKTAPVDQFNEKDARFRTCMFERHERKTPPPMTDAPADPLARQVLEVYQRYWWQATRDPATRPAEEKQLKAKLAALIGEKPPAEGEEAFEALTDRLSAELGKRGMHALQGRTPPLYDLLVWGKQEEKDYTVDLPSGEKQPVRVFLMDDWVSRGWSRYTACERTGTGGWVKPEGLYAVHSAYGDLTGEDFQASFLGHEAQHFADLKRWPDMKPWVLEYRAKLTELFKSDKTHMALLDKFYRSRDDEPDHPHPYANKQVIIDIVAKMGLPADSDLHKSDPLAVRKAARDVLIEDTRKREAETPPAAAGDAAAKPKS